MTDIKDRLKRAKRRETTEDVCLRGDLAGQYEALQRKLDQLPPNNKLAGDPERQRIQVEMDRIRVEMAADTIPFVLRALSEPKYQALVDAHPPRRAGDEVDARDAEVGFNRSTFYAALIRASVVEPQLDDGDWSLLFGEGLSPGQFGRLGLRALEVNNKKIDVPFSPAVSNESPG